MPTGRSTDYSPQLCDEIVKNCSLGDWKATDEQIADFCGVERMTVYRWKQKYPEFNAAIRKAKVLVDNRVEGALFHQACSGNVTAMIYWLQCRRPTEWRNKQEVDLRTPDGVQVEHSVSDILKLLQLAPEQKAELTRKHRAYLEELRQCALLPETTIDVEPEA